MAGGALQPLSQAVLLEAFPPEKRGKAMGFWGLGIVVAPILGPVLGGWLTDSYSWRWVFYINIPVGIASIVMTRLFIFDPPYVRRASQHVDYWGIGMLTVGIGALQVVLDKGQEQDWFSSHWITGLLLTAIISLTLFVLYELRTLLPVVNLRVFKQRTYSTHLAANPARIPLAPSRNRHGSARSRIFHRDAAYRQPDVEIRCAQIPGFWTGRRRNDHVSILPAESQRRILGFLLASVHSRLFIGHAVRAPHHDHYGPDRERKHGKCHQHL
jgi:hypothetical protein